MLGSFFITAGLDGVRNPSGTASATEPLVRKTLEALPREITHYLPQDPETYVRITGATQLVAGLALASGKAPRIASFVLAGTLIPTTLAGLQETDPALKAQQKTQLWKDVSILGGLIIAGIDTEGRPGLSWRARRAARHAAATVAAVIPGGGEATSAFAERAHELADGTHALAEKAGDRLSDISDTVGARASALGELARDKAPVIADYARERSAELAKTAQHRGAELAKTAQDRGAELAKAAQDRGAELAELTSHRGAELVNAASRGRDQVEAIAVEQRPKLKKLARSWIPGF